MKVKLTIFISLSLFGIFSCINPVYPKEQLLQHTGTFILMILLVIDLIKNKLSLVSFICVSMFVLFHIIGARYIYSYVPYDKWISALTIIDIL